MFSACTQTNDDGARANDKKRSEQDGVFVLHVVAYEISPKSSLSPSSLSISLSLPLAVPVSCCSLLPFDRSVLSHSFSLCLCLSNRLHARWCRGIARRSGHKETE